MESYNRSSQTIEGCFNFKKYIHFEVEGEKVFYNPNIK